jgi:hypothetical protein
MSGDGLRERWREWAAGLAIPPDRIEAAVDAALRVAGAGSDAAGAAARLAAGAGWRSDAELLRWALARATVAMEEVAGLRPSGPLTEEALGALAGVFGARRTVLDAALRPAPAPPPAAPEHPHEPARRPPPAPSARAFLGEPSILVLSGIGAFLLTVAAVLYEVYAIGELSGGLRFAGVLALDVVFGAAGWACLSSRRMRVVGYTYVAIFAVLAPLVGVAAYVFLGLRERGISVPEAQLVTGAALTGLYGVLSWRLRSQAYGCLALAALPVAWLGAIATAGPGSWHGPVAAALVAVYALAAAASRAVPDLGERFATRAALFAHGAAALALVVAATTVSSGTWEAATAATLAVIGAGYLAAWLLTATPAGAHLGLAALGAAWTLGTHALGLGGWSAAAAAALVPAYDLLGRSGTPVAAAARDLTHLAALTAAGLAAALWLADLEAGRRTAWWLPAALALLAGAYALHRVLTGQPMAVLAAAAATSLAVLAANAALGGGAEPAAVLVLALAAGWGLAAEATGDAALRVGLRAGAALQALVPVALVMLPPPFAVAALFASAVLLALLAWRTQAPVLALLSMLVVVVDWYWFDRAVLPAAPPSAAGLALLYSPLPVLLALNGMVGRLLRGWTLAWTTCAVAAALAVAVPAAALYGGDVGLAGRALVAYAIALYAVAAIERWTPAAGVGIGAAGTGLGLDLDGAGATPVAILVALSALSVVTYAGQFAWRWAGRAGWADAHCLLGLTGAGVVALAGFILPGTTVPGATADLLAAATVLVFAGLLVTDARVRATAVLDHAALVAASLAAISVAIYLDASDAQWYAAPTGLALLASGLALPHDRRVAAGGWLGPPATAAGAALLLGVTAAQAFADQGWAHTAWLVAEAVAAVLLGIATRSRALVVAGAAAAGVGGVRALFVLVQQGLLFAAFGAAALFLLGLGAALAALRDRLGGPLGAAWREWS